MIGKSDSLEGRVAMITGSSSGIGLCIARLFAERGAMIVMMDVAAERLEAAEVDGPTTRLEGSVAVRADVDRVVAAAIAAYGRIDILCNNAGIGDRHLPVGEMTDEVWERVLGVNLTGPFNMSRRVVPEMIAVGGGTIVNIASVSGLRGSLSGAAYVSSKHALIGLTRSITAMYWRQNIRCFAICPGSTLTGMPIGGEPSPLGQTVREWAQQTIPGRGQPEEIAEIAAFLASDRSSIMNGAVIVADKGWMAL